MRKYIGRCLILGLSVTTCLSGCGLLGGGTKPLLTIDETEYTAAEGEILGNLEMQRILQAYDPDFLDTKTGDHTVREYAEVSVLDSVKEILILSAAAQEEGYQMSENDSADALKLAQQFNEEAKTGWAEEDLTAAITDYTLASRYLVNIRSVAENSLNDEDCAVLEGKQIVVCYQDDSGKSAAWQKISAVKAKLDQGKSFQSLVSYQTEVEEIDVTFSRQEADRSWMKDAFNMEDGTISDIIEIEGGYMIFKCIDSFDEDLTEANKEALRQEAERRLIDSTCEKYLAGHQVNWDSEVWKGVDLKQAEKDGMVDFQSLYTTIFQ